MVAAGGESNAGAAAAAAYARGLERLLVVVQELALARGFDAVARIVCTAARELGRAAGASVVLRDGGDCLYGHEDAVAPLWKGKRLPMTACIEGWSMIHRREAAIEDVYADARIPQDAYRATFVKSLAAVPIRAFDPVGALGVYWAHRHAPAAEELKLLTALADAAAAALDNARVHGALAQQVREGREEIAAMQRHLDVFAHAVSHDLRAPVRAIGGFCALMQADHASTLGGEARRKLGVIEAEAERMSHLIDALLDFSRVGRQPLQPAAVDLTAIARAAFERLTAGLATRPQLRLGDLPAARGDRVLLAQALENLLANAVKFSARRPAPIVEVSGVREGDRCTYSVRDNGVGFEPRFASKLFGLFERLHDQSEYPGTGIGLAVVHRIVTRHGGQVSAESAPGQGAVFRFTLPSGA